jgi:hypothetical protein
VGYKGEYAKMKNSDLIFDVSVAPEFEELAPFIVTVVPKDFWLENHRMDDQPIDNIFLHDFFGEEATNIFVPFDDQLSQEDVTKMLLKAGFKQNVDFSQWIKEVNEMTEEDLNEF